jgi:putative transposase
VADITYIRLGKEFVYLAVVIDRFSRRAVGWALDRTLAARLAMTALRQAIALRGASPGLVHHSDRGVQYACREYVELLESHGIVPSMSRSANPYDNAVCESFMKTLKYEEIHCNQYRNLEELRANIDEFIEPSDESPAGYSLGELLSSRAHLSFSSRFQVSAETSKITINLQRTAPVYFSGCLN